jgi:hypothetical protein
VLIDYTTREKNRSFKKTCEKCGKVGWYSQGMRNCRFRKFGQGSYCCWGTLLSVAPATPVTVLTDADRNAQYRSVVAKKLAQARDTLAARQTRLKRIETAVAKWEKRVATLERRAARTDEELNAQRERARFAARIQRIRRRVLGDDSADDESC